MNALNKLNFVMLSAAKHPHDNEETLATGTLRGRFAPRQKPPGQAG